MNYASKSKTAKGNRTMQNMPAQSMGGQRYRRRGKPQEASAGSRYKRGGGGGRGGRSSMAKAMMAYAGDGMGRRNAEGGRMQRDPDRAAEIRKRRRSRLTGSGMGRRA
jgi:hypothetical protein